MDFPNPKLLILILWIVFPVKPFSVNAFEQDVSPSSNQNLVPRSVALVAQKFAPKTQSSTCSDLKSKPFKEGLVLIYNSRNLDAERSFLSALNNFQRMGNRLGEVCSLTHLGLVYRTLGQTKLAIQAQQDSIQIAEILNNPNLQGLAWNNLAYTYRAFSQYPLAITAYQKARQLKKTANDQRGEAISLNGLGTIYEFLGQPQRAIQFHQQALELQLTLNDQRGLAQSFNNLGNAFFSLKEFGQAQDFFEKALAINQERGNPPSIAKNLINLANVAEKQKRFPEAIELTHSAIRFSQASQNPMSLARAYNNLGNVYAALKDYPKAIAQYQISLKISQNYKYSRLEALTLGNIGTSQFRANQLTNAEQTLRESIQKSEQLLFQQHTDFNKISMFNTLVRNYRYLERTLVDQNKTNQALEVSEQGRARVLGDFLDRKSNTPSLARPTLESIKAIAKQQEATLVQYSVVYRDNDGNNTSQQTSIPSHLYIWVISPNGNIDFQVVDLNTINLSTLIKNTRRKIGTRYRAGLRSDPGPTLDNQLQSLYNLLIQPIASQLPSDPNQRVIFFPQDELFVVPFAALKAGDDTPYLIERHTLQTAPSIQILNQTRSQRQRLSLQNTISRTSPLIVGNPNYPRIWNANQDTFQTLPNLLGAEAEANAIAQLFNTSALIGKTATETTVKQRIEASPIVHLATHGLLEYSNPVDSGILDIPGAIALTPGGQEDGLLTAAEIQGMNLSAELVVLSACDSGLGDITGDGIVGLSRSLIAAGAPSVIVSLWSVPDAPTAVLMTHFYQQWQQTSDKAQALRLAMLKTMKTHPEPDQWAAFTLIGEAE